MFKVYEVRTNNKPPTENKIPDEVYFINEKSEAEKLDWRCPIEVARLAGLEIIEEEHNSLNRYVVRRKETRYK